MEYFVTGATGLIGTHVVRQLHADGHDVIALTRDRANAAHLPTGVDVVEGDVTDKASFTAAMTGVDGVFHVAAWFYVGPGPRQIERAERINVAGTRNVLELMAELDVPKGVYTSTVGVHPGTSDEVIDETVRPTKPTYAVYNRTKWEAHYEVARPMIESGLPLVVVLPSGVYGPHDKPRGSIRGMVRDYLTGDLPAIPRGLRLSFDHAADVADGHVRAMERGEPGEEYIVASEARTVGEVMECLETLTGISAPPTLPDAVFGGLSRVMRLYERVATPPAGLEPELLSFLAGRQFEVANSKARRELGVEFRSLEDGLASYLEWELDQMGMDDVPVRR